MAFKKRLLGGRNLSALFLTQILRYVNRTVRKYPATRLTALAPPEAKSMDSTPLADGLTMPLMQTMLPEVLALDALAAAGRL